jgi:tetratricopeptide (TPR) repeat protein
VIGRSFALDTVRAASGRSAEETIAGVEELAARGLVVELADAGEPALTFDFGHDIVRSVVYDDAGPARRRLLHGRVADALRAPGAPETRDRVAATAAHHLRLAGREDEAADELARAGEHAAALHAATEGLAHFRAALELGHPEPARLRERCGDLGTLLGRYEEAIADYGAAAAGAEGAAAAARIGHKLGALHQRRGDGALAEERLVAALAVLGSADPAARARILADAALTSHLSGDDAGAAARAGDALELAEASGDAAALAGAHNILGVVASGGGRLADARDHLERSREVAEGLTDATAHAAALNNLALVAGAEGRHEEAVALAEEALMLSVRLGDVHREAAIRNNLADLLHRAGRSEDAMRQLKRAVTLFAEVGAAEPERAEIWKLARW